MSCGGVLDVYVVSKLSDPFSCLFKFGRICSGSAPLVVGGSMLERPWSLLDVEWRTESAYYLLGWEQFWTHS